MAKIVDKVQKKKDIALASKELILQKGIQNITVAQVAQAAGIGKGTVYEYFKNKEEIVFELTNILLEDYIKNLEDNLLKLNTTRKKVKLFAEFFYDEKYDDIRTLYKSFVSLSLINPNNEMMEFQTQCINSFFIMFSQTIHNGVDNGELIKESEGLIKGLFVVAEGMFISSVHRDTQTNLKDDLNSYLDAQFSLLEVK